MRRSGFSRNRWKSKRKWDLDLWVWVCLPGEDATCEDGGWRMGWRAWFYVIAIKSYKFWNVIYSFRWSKGMTLQQTGSRLISIHLMQITATELSPNSKSRRERSLNQRRGGVRITVKRRQKGHQLDFQFRFHGSFHILTGYWKAAWALASLTPQPDSNPRLVTAAGRFLPDGDSCEPIVSVLKRLNKSWCMPFTVVQSPKIFHMMSNSFVEKLTSALSSNLQNHLLIHGHHMFWVFHVSRVWGVKFLFLWHTGSTGGRVGCCLRSPRLFPCVVTRD